MTNMPSELLNCPFCGSRAEIAGVNKISCSNEYCGAYSWCMSEDKWNTRTSPSDEPKKDCDTCHGIGDITIFKGQHPHIDQENIPCPDCKPFDESKCEHEWVLINGGTHCKKCHLVQTVLCSKPSPTTSEVENDK